MNKNKVSKKCWGGVTDFLGGLPPQNGPAGNPDRSCLTNINLHVNFTGFT